MAATLRDTTQTATAATASSITGTKPSGTAENDILLAFHTSNAGNLTNMTAPGGWTLLTSRSGTNLLTKIWWKVAGSSEGSSYTFNQNSGALGVLVLAAVQGGDTSTPIFNSGTAGSNQTVTCPAITLSAGALDLRYATAIRPSPGGTLVFTPPSSYTEQADIRAGEFPAGSLATREITADGSAGSRNFSANTISLETRAGYSVGIEPGGTSATATPDVVTATASVPAPTVAAEADATATPAAVTAVASIPAPSVSDGSAPILRAVSTGADQAATVTVEKPSGTADGDMLIAVHGTDVGTLADMTTPTGGGATWQLLDDYEVTGGELHQVKVWWKIAGVSEPSSWSFPQDSDADGVAIIAALQNADDATPVINGVATSSSTTVDTPGVTPPNASSVELRFVTAVAPSAARTWTPPAGFTEQADAQSTTYTTGTLATRTLSSSSATGTETFTASGEVTFAHGYTIAVAGVAAPAGDATATPSAVTGTASVPAPTVSTGSIAAPAAVEASTSIATPATQAGSTAAPGAVTATASIPAPSTSTGTTAAPAVVVAATSVPAPAVAAGATAAPAAAQATASVPPPTVTAVTTTAPQTVHAQVTIPTASITTGATAAPDVVESTATIAAPTVQAAATATPAVVSATTTIPTPQAATGSTATPAAMSATVTVPAPAVQSGSSTTAAPTTVQATATIPTPDTSTGTAATPPVVAATASIPAPTASASATASPSVVEASTTIPAPATGTGATATPATVEATTSIPTPTTQADGNATATPGVVHAAATIPDATTGVSVTATPTVVLATAAVPTPTTTVLVAATPAAVQAYASIPAALISTTARPPAIAAVASIPAPATSIGEPSPVEGDLSGALLTTTTLNGARLTSHQLDATHTPHQLGGERA